MLCQVKHLLDQYELRGMETLGYVGFVDIMKQLETVGWVRVQKKESTELTEIDIDEIFCYDNIMFRHCSNVRRYIALQTDSDEDLDTS